MKSKRYSPSIDFPPYSFLPGVNTHPTMKGGHMYGKREPVSLPIDLLAPEKCEFLRYALDLYNHKFYWEAHVYLEALWNAHNRKGEAADFFRALIMFAAAGVKRELGNPVSEAKLLKSACSLLRTVVEIKGDIYLGFELSKLLKNDFPLEIHPTWR